MYKGIEIVTVADDNIVRREFIDIGKHGKANSK